MDSTRRRAVERYRKLRALARDSGASDGEREAARRRMAAMEDRDPDLRATVDAADAPPPSAALPPWVAQAVAGMAEEATRRGRARATSTVDRIVREAADALPRFVDSLFDDLEDRMSRTRRPPPSSRLPVAALLDKVDASAVTLDEDGEDVVYACVRLPFDVADALIDRADDSPKVGAKIGAIVLAVIEGAAVDGEAGDWPFYPDEDEDEDE